MTCLPLVEWDGRTWRVGEAFRVVPDPARPRASGFGGVLLGLEVYHEGPRGLYAIIWYEDDLGRKSTSVWPGEMHPDA